LPRFGPSTRRALLSQKRFFDQRLVPATRRVWVRGYGLVDSPRTEARRGRILDLDAVAASNPRAAAYSYPAGYWYSMLELPAAHEISVTGPEGNGISPTFQHQAQWRSLIGNNHQRFSGCRRPWERARWRAQP